jgi:hypothetical protein
MIMLVYVYDRVVFIQSSNVGGIPTWSLETSLRVCSVDIQMSKAGRLLHRYSSYSDLRRGIFHAREHNRHEQR